MEVQQVVTPISTVL